MKKQIILLSLFALVQTKSIAGVPDAVKKAFEAMFPDVKKAHWEKEKTGNYEAEFTREGREISAVFDQDGKWKETETQILPETLPEPVKRAIERKYTNVKIKECFRLQKPGGAILYEAEIKADGKKREVILDENGTIQSQ